jgi:ribose-phosphate pyrophosphokinase
MAMPREIAAMQPRLIAGQANPPLAESIARCLNVQLVGRTIRRFADGELHVELEEAVRGDVIYVIQPTGPPVDAWVFEMLFLADACRRAGAASVIAVIPYFGYARQDRRATGREAVGARLVADMLAAGGIDRVVAVDLHLVSLEGFFAVPLEHLTAVPAIVERLRARVTAASVIVAPDLGAAKLAEHFAQALHLPVAIVHKRRLTGEQVRVRAITGEVRGRAPIVVDDMISTGGTIEAAVAALLSAGCQPDLCVAATHGVLVGAALERLARLRIRALIVSDSLAIPTVDSPPLEVVSIAPLLADAIDRLHHRRSLGDLIKHE